MRQPKLDGVDAVAYGERMQLVEYVVGIHVARLVGIELAAQIVCRTEGKDALVVEYGVPLHAGLKLEVRHLILVYAHGRGHLAAAGNDVDRRGRVVALDVAPVVFGRYAYREVARHLPAYAELDFGYVAVAVVSVHDASHVGPYVLIILRILDLVADAAVRRDADGAAQSAGYRECYRQVVEVDCVVCRFSLIRCRPVGGIFLLVVAEVRAVDAEVHEEALRRSHAQCCRIQRIDLTGVAKTQTHAAHRPHGDVARRRQLARPVHRVGRIGVYAARLRRGFESHSREGRSQAKYQFILYLHCSPKFCSIRKPPIHSLQISHF